MLPPFNRVDNRSVVILPGHRLAHDVLTEIKIEFAIQSGVMSGIRQGTGIKFGLFFREGKLIDSTVF